MKCFLVILIFISFIFQSKAQRTALTQSSKNGTILVDPSQLKKLPMFPGGQKAFYKFLGKNLKWPGDTEATGKVIVDFYIEKNGRLTNFKIVKSMGEKLDAEALRVLKKSPKWIPGRLNGKKVRVKHEVSINFTLSE